MLTSLVGQPESVSQIRNGSRCIRRSGKPLMGEPRRVYGNQILRYGACAQLVGQARSQKLALR
jgi:hypothetical protein